ncbi:MAG: aminotransferase class I/II-fold pyridoxal phosphate-dependent enzyme [Candidatus Heimdallarchaeota archaeon]|nr:aminotransferase class I/II-fold pyridoxal phosphate-dependent enzyme [Candidatus Heimdallarchaeota archaeon]
MKVDTFLVEQFMDTYEMEVELNIAETCVKPFILNEFLELMGKESFFNEFKKKQLTYGHINGSPELRQGIANLYDTMKLENILISGGAIGANFLTFYSLIEPKDHVVTIFPAYQQLYSTARSFGANVKLWKMIWEDQWKPNIDDLSSLVNRNTKMIVINNPHNPTGFLFSNNFLKEIIEIAEDVGAYLLYDEAYRGLYLDESDKVTSIVDCYEKGISTGSFSKGLSLTGLRLGWIAANKQIIEELVQHRQYTTISNGIIDDALGALAMSNVDRIYKRNTELIKINHKILSNWIKNEPLIDWIPAKAGSVAFLKLLLDIPTEEFCLNLIKEKSTFLVPGTCFEMEGYLRIGFGNDTEILRAGLSRLKEFLNKYR